MSYVLLRPQKSILICEQRIDVRTKKWGGKLAGEAGKLLSFIHWPGQCLLLLWLRLFLPVIWLVVPLRLQATASRQATRSLGREAGARRRAWSSSTSPAAPANMPAIKREWPDREELGLREGVEEQQQLPLPPQAARPVPCPELCGA